MEVELSDAFEVVTGRPRGDDAEHELLITCDHASERLPEPWEWPKEDRWLVGTHWAYDIGASDLARELAERMGVRAVLSRFSRLLVDPNRPQDSPELFRTRAEGRPVRLNEDLTEAERNRRIDRMWKAYHDAVDRGVRATGAPIILAMHTFTPSYEGQRREVEVGVLYDDEELLAETVGAALAKTGLRVGMNAPYSGKLGMMYSADRHARSAGKQALELEVRQDLAVEATVRARIGEALTEVLRGG